ncbi:hypothetical protein M758_12G186000 [Ceratodon purpureus]|uniref:Uncharacterized protein n=1 Tax=Ceratodon purpureus TaxID=3225 RepID=A0A8T0GA69_CERPU|nr:hypothetical protein KC19_12G182400 [Ceratodon purpureus]KAG0599899.1 hypothetical protein M758_12G186000 [Ceratodon purpureus]
MHACQPSMSAPGIKLLLLRVPAAGCVVWDKSHPGLLEYGSGVSWERWRNQWVSSERI